MPSGWKPETHPAQRYLGPAANDALPPMFLPFKLKEMALNNRMRVPHVHVQRRGWTARGLAPGPWGPGKGWRRSGLHRNDQRQRRGPNHPWMHGHLERRPYRGPARIDFVHQHTGAKMAIQIGHAWPRAQPARVGSNILDEPLPVDQQWPLLSASAVPFDSQPLPQAMDRADMDRSWNSMLTPFTARRQRL